MDIYQHNIHNNNYTKLFKPEMMIGERNQSNQTVLVPPWNFPDDASYGGGGGGMSFSLSPNSNANANFNVDDFPLYLQNEALTALQRYLPSNDVGLDLDGDGGGGGGDMDLPLDAYSNDSFRMFEFKVRKCTRSRSHDWTDCPFAHPGEKARRRDPRKFHYSGTACPDFRKGYCKRGDSCEYAHGVFECWLHPSRYRTQPCKDGVSCTRRVCFFAHTPEQLRILSPRNHGSAELFDSPPSDSPPMSPISNSLSHSLGSASVSEMNHMISSLRQLQLNKVKSMPKSWGLGLGLGTSPPGYGSPRFSMIRPEFSSLPSTPTRSVTRPGLGFKDIFEDDVYEEEPVMERVESGKGLRARMFEKLSKENPLDRDDPNQYDQYLYSNPDIDWISDLVNQS